MCLDLGNELDDVGIDTSNSTTAEADTKEGNLGLGTELDAQAEGGLECGITGTNSDGEGLGSDAIT